jgi:hypothetical protein
VKTLILQRGLSAAPPSFHRGGYDPAQGETGRGFAGGKTTVVLLESGTPVLPVPGEDASEGAELSWTALVDLIFEHDRVVTW